MRNMQKKYIMSCFFILLAAATLAACGNDSSSTAATTVPTSATTFYAHNLVFRNSTTLSMGYNAFGQLGTGTLANRATPGPLKHYYPFNGFATGGDHSVAFFNNSTVRTWGYNATGQLGNNTTTYSSVPVKAHNISNVTAVAAGAFHTLALKNDGSVWAWGSNDVGQLGIGWNKTTPLKEEKVPHEVTGVTGAITNISMIAANGKHSLALANDGKVWAWGANSLGQLGINPVNTGALADPIALTELPAGITAISAGGGFSYAVVGGDGTVLSWGINDNGQLGNGAFIVKNIEGCSKQHNYCFKPYPVIKSDGTNLADVVQVAGGIQHGLARDKTGNVWAWGYNFFGQLGNNGNLDSAFAVPVVMTSQGTVMTGATDIRAFGSSSMAKIDGVWYVWGDNVHGQLGLGTNTSVSLPKKMSGFQKQ